ncbi:transposase [Catellatospora citrea]|uniref:transposase n=1 Tax=Catellatospora citrea TaxID=53366 RepID=UPI0033E56FAB
MFWIVDNGSSHHGQASVDRMAAAWANATVVHTPLHASWLNQIEIYFSVVQRKVVTPNGFYDLADVENRLDAFHDHYNLAAHPFDWRYTKQDRDALLKRLDAHQPSPVTTEPPTN